MMSADDFKRAIKGATTKGAGSSIKGPGTTGKIAAALEAFDQSVAQGQAQAEQAAYLYQVLKNCNAWMALKFGQTGGNTDARRAIINRLRIQALWTLRNQYPMIQQALDRYQGKKDQVARNPNARPTTTPLYKVYAHEGKAYRDTKDKLKAKGQFHDPGLPRFAPSATLINNKVNDDAIVLGKMFADLTFDEYAKLDRTLGAQYKVLYMSKLQRLNSMVAVENNLLVNATDNTPVNHAGSTVADDLGQGPVGGTARAYACDRYGNLFITDEHRVDQNGNRVQVNHSTLLAGNEVLCAGTISIKQGKLRGISNLSGHYHPDTAALTQMIRYLQQEGVDIRNIVVIDTAQGTTTEGAMFLQQKFGQFPVMWRGSAASHMQATT